MGCVIAKANDDTVYINNASNYSSTKTHDSFVVECYDKDGTMLTSKKTSHNILDSVRLKKNCESIEVYCDKGDKKAHHQSFQGPFKEGQFLSIDPVLNIIVESDCLVLPKEE